MTFGTSHFRSKQDILNYYKPYGISFEDIDNKIKRGEIHIGKPKLEKGETLGIIKNEGRYSITTK